MTITALLDELWKLGITCVLLPNGDVKLKGKRSTLTPDIIEQLRQHKQLLQDHLKATSESRPSMKAYRIMLNGKPVSVLSPHSWTKKAFEEHLQQRFPNYDVTVLS